LPIARFYTPEEFRELRDEALRFGFRHVESGPLVRSSYHAHEQAESTSAPQVIT
jgi:lipoic acid synthetase